MMMKKLKTKYNLINNIIKDNGILLRNLLQCLHKIVLKKKEKFYQKKINLYFKNIRSN